MIDIKYRISTFPSSEQFRIFRVINTHIWQIITQKAYYLDDDLEWDYFDFVFDDPVTAKIIADYIQEAEAYGNKMGKCENK